MRFSVVLRPLAIGLSALGFAAFGLGAAPVVAAAFPPMPSCQSVGRAIAAAYGPVGRVEDDTAGTTEIEAYSTGLPYKVLRACSIYMPGHRVPLSVTFNAPMNRMFIEGMGRMSQGMGLKAQKLDGASYGDLAYMVPQTGGGTAVDALVGEVGIAITTWADAEDTEKMAAHIVALIK